MREKIENIFEEERKENEEELDALKRADLAKGDNHALNEKRKLKETETKGDQKSSRSSGKRL